MNIGPESFRRAAAAAAFCALAFPSSPALAVSGPAVDIVLCLDSTGSMSASEWNLEKTGTVSGLQNALPPSRLDGRTRVTVVQFPATTSSPTGAAGVKVAPTILDSQAALDSVTSAIAALPQLTGGGTNISSCIDVAKASLCGAGNCPDDATTRIIDISTDGAATSPTSPTVAQAAAVASAQAAFDAGIDAVNIIGVGDGFELADAQQMVRPAPATTFIAANGEFPAVGDRGFVIVVSTFNDYTPAIQAKLAAELTVCGDGRVNDEAELCDDGASNGEPGSCCTVQCLPASAGSVCRQLAGACDVAETCDGTSASCPADAKSTAVCRAAAGSCDVAETCDGVSDGCPADALLPSSSVCRASQGECDAPESCTGASAACPTDVTASAGTPCAADGNVCTDDVCDGAGACGTANTASCEDGLYCNGVEVCAGGSCVIGTPPPCGDVGCTTCDEGSHACGNIASGAACADEGDQCTSDLCDGAGACAHDPIRLAPLCKWVVVGGSDTRESLVRTRYLSVVGGSICSDRGEVGESSLMSVAPSSASWALVADSGSAARVRPHAAIANGSIVTGGGCVEGLRGAWPFDTVAGPVCCASSPVALPGGNPANVIDACGLDPLLVECDDAKAQVPGDVAFLDALPSTANLGTLVIAPGQTYTIAAGAGLNVVDIDKLRMGTGSTLTIDAQGNADAVVVVRLARGMSTKQRVTFELAGGATAANVLFYGATGNCNIGWNNVGSGSILCPEGKVRLKVETVWAGAIAGGTGVDLGWNTRLAHEPFLGFLQP